MGKHLPREVRERAQDEIISQIVGLALNIEEEQRDKELADAIRVLGARLAKQYRLSDIPGLPDTFQIPF